LEVACTRGEGMPSARVTSAQWVASRSPVCQQHQGHSLSEYGMCSGMGRHGSDDPDGSTVSPGVGVCDVLAGESCCKGLGFGVLVIDSGLPSADASDGSGVLPTCDGNDELGMVDGAAACIRAAVAAEATRANTKVVTFGGSVHLILFMLVKIKTLGMLIGPQVLHFCLSIMKTVAATILKTRGNSRQEFDSPA
jgi:hypothetical protein